MTTEPRILKIAAEDTYSVRRPVLRPNRPAEECIFEGDLDPQTFHLGIYIEDTLAGVASFMHTPHPAFNAPIQFQLRGMAVLPNFQKRALGEKLLLEGELLLKKQFQNALLWFNARESAVDFYKKYDYQTEGDFFMIPNVCRHIVMFKPL
jgi:predicted GNAT family N-acyltransferase